jgi:hypothetical protein
MRRIILSALASLLTCPSFGALAPGEEWYSIKAYRDFADVRRQLQQLVDADAVAPRNRFCVVGQHVSGDRQAYVHWPARNKLILWEPRDDPRAVLHSRRYLDLHRDVADDPGGSSYILTRDFVAEVIAACRRVGDTFVVQRTRPR